MATAIVADEMRKDPRIDATVVNVADLKLAMPGLAPTEDSKKLQQLVKDATAVVLSTPEYHGSYSSGADHPNIDVVCWCLLSHERISQ